MASVRFDGVNNDCPVEYLDVDVSLNVYFTLSMDKLIDMFNMAKKLKVDVFNIHYRSHIMTHSLDIDGETSLLMGTYGEEGEIDSYWCDMASIRIETKQLKLIVDKADGYVDGHLLRLLCRVNGGNNVDITAKISISDDDYIPFGFISHKQCTEFVDDSLDGREYKVTYQLA